MSETLHQPIPWRKKVVKWIAALSIGAAVPGLSGCSAEPQPDMYKMSVDITCTGQSAYGMPEVLSYENDVISPINGKVDRITVGCETRSMDFTSSPENDAQPANDIEVWKITKEEQGNYVPKLVYEITKIGRASCRERV